jgi:hypothetical protein
MFTGMLTIGFMMRNTSPVGWIPCLFLKVVYHSAFKAYLIGLIFVAIPLIALCIWVDSQFYFMISKEDDKQFEWVLTSVNFLKVNVLQGLSKYFGDHNLTEYILKFLPGDIFRAYYPFLLISMWQYGRDQRIKN